MTNSILEIQLPLELKQQVDALFAELGLSTAEAIVLFLEEAVQRGGLPFQPIGIHPNAETLAAMLELEQSGGERFQTVAELFGRWR
jgi:DNA-damage-inducible protein J